MPHPRIKPQHKYGAIGAWHRLARLGVSGLALGLAACSVGRDYQPPTPDVPAAWVEPMPSKPATPQAAPQVTPKTAEAQAPEPSWWTGFADPTLDRLITRAETQNLDLQAAEARIAQARAALAGVDAALLPSGNIKATATREANQIAMPGGTANPSAAMLHKPFNVFQSGFDASWELDLFSGTRRRAEAAMADVDAAQAAHDAARVSLRAEIARTYVAIRQAQAQITLAEANQAAAARAQSLAQERFAAGEASRYDVAQASLVHEQVRQTLPGLRAGLKQSLYALDVLLGEKPGAAAGMVGAGKDQNLSGHIPTYAKDIALVTPAAVIARRPDLREAERHLAAATARQGAALAAFFPDLSLNGFFGALNTTPQKLLTGGSESWLVSGGLLWPILSYGSLSANLDAADAAQQEALALYRKTVLSALADVETALAALDEQKQIAAAAHAARDQATQAKRIAHQRFSAGLTSRLEDLDAERALLAAQDRVAQADGETALKTIALAKSLAAM